VRAVEAEHDVSRLEVDRPEMLKQAAKRAVNVEVHASVQDVGDRGAGSKDLVARNDDEPEVRDHVDPEPSAPRA
jgi:hypothetical protein